MPLRIAFLSVCLLVSSVDMAMAVVIDDFLQGEITLDGPSELIAQFDLDPQHVVGGARHVQVTRGSTILSIGNNSGLNIDQGDDWGYFQILYGFDSSLNVDFTADGHDRLRLRFNDVESNWWRGAFWVSVNSPLPPSSSAPGPLLSQLHGGGIIEIPFGVYSADFSDVSTFAIDVVRIEQSRSFSIAEIVTAGPPLQGDYNRNGIVDAGDLIEWERTFGRKTYTSGAGGYLSTDDNLDGVVDGSDFLSWQRQFNGIPNFVSASIRVPEPCIGSFYAVLVMTCVLFRHRRSILSQG